MTCLCIRKFKIQYWDKCQNRSLPVVMVERHLFATAPTTPSIAIHHGVTPSLCNLRLICRLSITLIADRCSAEYGYPVCEINCYQYKRSKCFASGTTFHQKQYLSGNHQLFQNDDAS